MITTAILATIGGSLLFASQNYDIQPNHQNIQNVVSILEAPSKTEKKVKKYTNNLSAQRIENMTYLVRDDGWIPYYLEPIDESNIYSPAFYGQISTQYNLAFDKKITDISALKLELENFLGFNLKEIIVSGSSGIMIKIDKKLTAQEVEYIKAHISEFQNVIWSDINSGILPEYQTQYYMDLLNNSLIPEKVEKTQPSFHPDFPDYEIFEQTEIGDVEKTKDNSISENYDVYGQNYIHHFRKNSEFIQSKIRADGLVPLMEKKLNPQKPFYDAILGVKPNEFYIGAYPFSQNKTNLIEYFQEITGLKIISYKKGDYFTNDTPSYNLIIDLEGVTQYEIYLIRKNMMNNHTDIFMNKKYIVLPEYQNTEILNRYYDYIENMSTMSTTGD